MVRDVVHRVSGLDLVDPKGNIGRVATNQALELVVNLNQLVFQLVAVNDRHEAVPLVAGHDLVRKSLGQ